MPAAAAMMSICDSRAKVLVLLPGARQAPVAKGCDPAGPCQPGRPGGGAMIGDGVELLRAPLARIEDIVIPEDHLARSRQCRS